MKRILTVMIVGILCLSTFSTLVSAQAGPFISSVSPITATQLQTIEIDGSGFGNTWPQTVTLSDGSVDTVYSSTTSSMEIADEGGGSHSWPAGYSLGPFQSPLGIYLLSWSDNEIILGGFGTVLGTNEQGRINIAAGDPLTVWVFTPSGYAVYHTTVAGSPPEPTYSVTFTESGLAQGTQWSVTFNGQPPQSSTSNSITFSVPNGVYPFSITPPTGYVASPSCGSISVNGVGVTQLITFAPSISIDSIEPVQVVYGSPLVAGKTTILRVNFLSTYGGAELAHITLSWTGRPTPYRMTVFVYPGLTSQYLPFSIFPEAGTFSASCTIEETGNTATTGEKMVKDTDRLRLLYVPVHFSCEQPPSRDEIAMEQKMADKFVLATYPIAEAKYSSEVDWSGIAISTGLFNTEAERLYGFFVADTQLKLLASAGYDHVIAIMPSYHDPASPASNWFKRWFPTMCDTPPPLGWGQPNGMFGRSAGASAWAEEGYWDVVAHEIGHFYGLPDSSTWPDAYGYWASEQMKIGDSSDAYLCFMTTALNWPICFRHLPPDNRIWICKTHYEYLLGKLKRNPDPETLLLSGLAFANGMVEFLPWYHLLEDAHAPDIVLGEGGDYTIQFLDNIGRLLAQTGFNMTFTYFNVTSFCFTVPYVNNTAVIHIVSNGTVLATRIVSPNAPKIDEIHPSGGEILSAGANVTISWGSSDQDGDPLEYMALYSPDNGSSWIPIQTGVTETSLNWTVPNDHPADQCRVKVVATDGVNTGEAISNGTFTILRHGVSTDDIQMPKSITGNGYSMPINVTVSNSGNYTETPKIDIYANATLINSQTVTLPNGSSTTIILAWNTTGFSLGNYTISAYAWPVPDEIDTSDNTLADGMVKVTIPGDVVDSYFKVDMGDISSLCDGFGATLGPDGYYWHKPPGIMDPFSPNLDIDGNGRIDMGDIVTALDNFGQHYP